MLDLVDAYTLVLNGIPVEEIPVSEHYAAIIKRFRPFETREESAEEISRISRLRKSYVLKLKKAYKDIYTHQGSWPKRAQHVLASLDAQELAQMPHLRLFLEFFMDSTRGNFAQSRLSRRDLKTPQDA